MDIKIPNITTADLTNLGNKLNIDKITLRIPVLNIVFSNDPDGVNTKLRAENEMKLLRSILENIIDFYFENSFGSFTFDFKVKTVILNHEITWSGQITEAPNYDNNGKLINTAHFPEEEEYVGFMGGVIALKKASDGTDVEHLRNYNAISERNISIAALNSLSNQVDKFEWDDDLTFSKWMNFGIPLGNSRATICFTSRDLTRGIFRNFGTWKGEGHIPGTEWPFIELPIDFNNRILNKFTFSDLSSWTGLAHELGHLLGFPERYNRNSDGFLGRASLMGEDWYMNHFEALLKLKMGWLSPIVIVPDKSPLEIQLAPIYESPKNVIICYPDIIGIPDEFFLIEVRVGNHDRWDGQKAKFDQSLPNKMEGLYIYHINTAGISKLEPEIDLEGDTAISGPDLVVFNSSTKSKFTSELSTFYNGSKSGLNVEVIGKQNNSYQLKIFWSYNRATAEFNYLVNNTGYELIRLANNENWRKTWDIIIPGNFGGNGYTDLLFYDRVSGEAQFFITDGRGDMNQIGATKTGWRKTWDIIIPGNFGGNGYTDLLFYDRVSGEAQFFITDGRGDMNQIGATKTGWRKTWDIIIPGNFGGNSYTDLLFYDRVSGEAQFFITDGRGDMNQIGATKTGWRKTWDIIIPGNFGGNGYTDLLFYDRLSGEAQFFITDGRGDMNQIGATKTGWRKTWDIIIPFKWIGESKGMLFYDSTNSTIEIFTSDMMGDMTRQNKTLYTRKSWDMIISGNFLGRVMESFLFYDNR